VSDRPRIRSAGTIPRDRFAGCLLGLALGDALGAPHEGGPLERLLWKIVGRTWRGRMRWTDDTQMALDLAESLLAEGKLDPDDLARRFAGNYRWSRGYGRGAARLLKRIGRGEDWRRANRAVFSDGSFGNGAAMRVPVIGLFFGEHPEKQAEAVRLSAQVTHAHPLAIEGALLVATATSLALASSRPMAILEEAGARCEREEFIERLDIAAGWLRGSDEVDAHEVVRRLGHGMAACESCVTSIYLAQRFGESPFEDLIAFAIECGGDVDTIAAMAGAVWGASRGATSLPSGKLERLEQRGRLGEVASKLYEAVVREREEGAGRPPARR
jgi:poly(ADP-ribose) glycohydrolase ARH3